MTQPQPQQKPIGQTPTFTGVPTMPEPQQSPAAKLLLPEFRVGDRVRLRSFKGREEDCDFVVAHILEFNAHLKQYVYRVRLPDDGAYLEAAINENDLIKAPPNQTTIRTCSVERITHYNCGHCGDGQSWWSIADKIPKVGDVIYCPHCGAGNLIDVVQNAEMPTLLDIAYPPLDYLVKSLFPWDLEEGKEAAKTYPDVDEFEKFVARVKAALMHTRGHFSLDLKDKLPLTRNAKFEFFDYLSGTPIKAAFVTTKHRLYPGDDRPCETTIFADGLDDESALIDFGKLLDFDYIVGTGSPNLEGVIWFPDGSWSVRMFLANSEYWIFRFKNAPPMPEDSTNLSEYFESIKNWCSTHVS